MFLFSTFCFSSSSLGYWFVSENFERTMFQIAMVSIMVFSVLYLLFQVFFGGLENGGVHHVRNRRVELPMRTVHNPFRFEVNLNRASNSGVECTFSAEKDIYLLAIWGIPIHHLFRLLSLNPHALQNAIVTSDAEMISNVCQNTSHLISVEGGEEKTMILKPEIDSTSESSAKPTENLLRTTYPFVAIMIFKDFYNPETHFIAMATSVHLSNEKLKQPAHVIGQHLKPMSGDLNTIKKVYLSSPETLQDDGENVHLCVACCTNPVSAVILPCSHACVCTTCLEKCKNCPVCRGTANSYFELQNVSAN